MKYGFSRRRAMRAARSARPLSVWHQYLGNERAIRGSQGRRIDGMSGSYLGPSFGADEVCAFLDTTGAAYRRLPRKDLTGAVARMLAEGKVVGWFQGRMEFGPRALGNRSILGDPRSPVMQSQMNLRIKYRESFRPFAPSIAREHVGEFFDLETDSPYMLLVAPVRGGLRVGLTPEQESLFGIERLNVPHSSKFEFQIERVP
jgi:carbamoyltransferase